MNIVISALHYDWTDMPHCLARATGEFGLDGVELSLAASFRRPHCTREDLAALPAAGGAGALLLAHIWENLASMELPDARRAMGEWLDVCRATGITGLVIHGGSYPDRREGIARMRRMLEAVLHDYESAGVVLNVENHYAFDYHNCQELFSESWEFLELFDALPSPSLAFCFDTGHGHMTRNSPDLLRRLAGRLRHVHLADNHGVDDNHVGFGQGTVDFAGVLAILREIGFGGTYCIEFPVRDDQAPFHACLRALRSSGE